MYWVAISLVGCVLAAVFENNNKRLLTIGSLALPFTALVVLFINNWVLGLIVVVVIAITMYNVLKE